MNWLCYRGCQIACTLLLKILIICKWHSVWPCVSYVLLDSRPCYLCVAWAQIDLEMQLWTLSDCCSNWNITEIEYLVNSAYTGTCTLPSFSGISKKWNGIRKWTCSYYYQFWCLSSFINNNVAILVSSMAKVTNPGPSPVKDKHGDLPLTSVIHDCVHSV